MKMGFQLNRADLAAGNILLLFGLCSVCLVLAGATLADSHNISTAGILENLSAHIRQMNGSISDVYFMPQSSQQQQSPRQQVPVEAVENITYPITLVTAYFDLGNQSKHSRAEYEVWIPNFLSKVEDTPIVVFTSPDLVPTLLAMRKRCAKPGPTIFLTFADQWSLPWMQRPAPIPANGSDTAQVGKQRPNLTWRATYEAQLAIDPQKDRHSPSLYAVWNSKPWMLSTIAQFNPFSSACLLWVDVGHFSSWEFPFRRWPSPDALECSLSTCDRLLANTVSPITLERIQRFKEEEGPIESPTYVVGGIFGGRPSLVNWLYGEFARLHDKYLQMGFFVGREEPILTAVVMANPEKFALIPGYAKAADQCVAVSIWSYALHRLAASGEKLPNCPDFPFVYPDAGTVALIAARRRRQVKRQSR